jgi:2-haloacid dehalogenase
MIAVRAVLFDVFGTLVDYRTSIASALRRFGQERGIACDWYAFVDAWRAAYAPAMDRVRRGETPWQPLDALHAASLDELWQRFGLPPIPEDERTWLVRRWHELEPWPDVVAGLHELRRHVIVGSLSNGNVALQIDLARHAKLPFDVLFSAEHFRHYKPDAQTYLGALELLALPPGHVALAAAHNGDLRAAASHGLRTIFLPRPAEHGAKQTTDLVAEGPYDLIVHDVGAIATAVAGDRSA